jgi:hypothetical protein
MYVVNLFIKNFNVFVSLVMESLPINFLFDFFCAMSGFLNLKGKSFEG